MLTKEMVLEALPPKCRKNVTEEAIRNINKIISEPEMYETYRNNLMSFNKVINEGRFKVEEYLNAVMYVSYKLMGYTNIDAYARTFPDRMQRLSGRDSKAIAGFVSAYNHTKLVNLIYADAMVPYHVLNQDMFQKALNVQFEIMNDEKVSPKTRSDAANSLLTHLKPPETKKVELDIGIQENNGIADLRQALRDVSLAQLELINRGTSLKDVAESRLIQTVEAENVREI